MGRSVIVVAALLLTACARTEVVDLSRNQVLVSTRAAPACGEAGALRVANQMAAVAALRRGYDRFLILDAASDSNVRVSQAPGSTAYTTGTVTTTGRKTSTGSFRTYTPPQTVVTGRNAAAMRVLLLNPGEEGYLQGLDARTTLGPEWQAMVDDGVSTCQ